jgi:hypothetical protein
VVASRPVSLSRVISFEDGKTLKKSSVACARCEKVCVRYAIKHPREVRKAMQIAAENFADKTLVEVIPASPSVSVSSDELATGAAWDDYVESYFRCLHCNKAFLIARGYLPR